MSAHAVSLAETDRLESLVVPFIPASRAGSEIATLPLADVGPADMVYEGIVGRSRALRDRVDRLDLRRDGHGQRARRARGAPPERPALARVRQVQLRRDSYRPA